MRKGHSQEMPAEGSIFDVSPDVLGFNMRPAGGGVQPTETTQPPPSNYVSFNDPFFGAPIAFAQCHNTPGMDTPTTGSTASPPPVSGVHRSSGVDKIIEPFTIVLGEQIGSGMCYGGSREPAERCWSHDVES